MISDAICETVLICALRFDGLAWLEAHESNALAERSGEYVDTLTLFADPEDNFATFFALQRWLHGKGGETQGDEANDWLAYWQLFLILWQHPTPTAYVHAEYETRWQAAQERLPRVVAAVRQHILSTFGGARSRYVAPWWLALNKMQLGRFAEQLVKLEFAKIGAEIFTSDVDDRGIDFLIRLPNQQVYTIQVKAIRKYQAISLTKSNFSLASNVAIALVDFSENREPRLSVIPLQSWGEPLDELVGYQTEWTDKKSNIAYWQLHVDRKSLKWLDHYYGFPRNFIATTASE